ncbi:hypothetical protein CC78DRAFT_475904 [Lojkania enalia]|uniref:Mitochondrial outer membrane protein n=1 Tax=Lojkania enalia TaxID=147567 RepID=A0A9P4JZA1_9PLEO|nr:hypothetical protein CC78DRAFT_475904 [Didymosphaeria enalia]
MPPDNPERNENTQNERRHQTSRNIFAIPAPIKRLFDRFPLLTYPANELPLRAPRNRQDSVLYVFTTDDGAATDAPSYNPACLKWQTYLKFSNINFRTASANNHASPTGSLPFLLPASADLMKPTQPISSGKLQKWAMKNSPSAIEEPSDLRYEAYLSLLDHKIRRAWLYTVYLSSNSTCLAEPLYIIPTSSNPFVRLAISHELRRAAESELLKFSAVINSEMIYQEAEEAFASLEMLLGENTWFFKAERPSLFDASIFSYTHLLLDKNLGKGWQDCRLRDAVLQRESLVAHRSRILTSYFPKA